MKTSAIVALVAVVALVSFGLGASSGYTGLLLSWMVGNVLLLTVPAATGILGVIALLHAGAAKVYKSKANWSIFFKVAAGVYGVTFLGSLLFAYYVLSNGFR